MGTGTTRPRRARGGRGGFTLAEIMIAMGILAVGMGMIAGALHAGISAHVRTMDDVMRQLIAENMVALVQTKMRHATNNRVTEDFQLVTSPNFQNTFGPDDMKFPTGDQSSRFGAAVLIRKRGGATAANDYEVLVVPYRLIGQVDASSGVNVQPVNASVKRVGATSQIQGASSGMLQVGRIVIDDEGRTAVVTAAPSPTTAVLDGVLGQSSLDGNTKNDNWSSQALTVVYPTKAGNLVECSKAMRINTALPPEDEYYDPSR